MSTRNWTRGGVGLAVAFLAAMSVTACDPFLKANTDAPVVLGVTMVDLQYNTYFNGVLPLDNRSNGGCNTPYAQPDQAWADAAFPGLCVPGGPTTVCPVLCYPSRTGPAYAPFYQGNLGGSYKKADGTLYTYALASSYTVNGVPTEYLDADGNYFQYGQILILFNKTMDPQTIQPNPNVARPPPGLTITEDDVDVTDSYAFEYNPNSDTSYWGASLTITGPDGFLDNTVSYHVSGTVKDQQGNPVTIDVTVNTRNPIDETPILASYTVNPATYAVGTAIAPNVPTVVGGPAYGFTVTPALPAGLTLDPDTGIITGTPTAAAATATYTVEVSNGAGATTLDLVITVTGSAP